MHKALQKKYAKPQNGNIQTNQTDETIDTSYLANAENTVQEDRIPYQKQSKTNHEILDSVTKQISGLASTNSLTDLSEKQPKLSLVEKMNYARIYNAHKSSCRVTSDCFPATKKLQKSMDLPLAAVVIPYISLYSPESFPLVKHGTGNELFRCDSCRAYINPFTMFLVGGKKYRCNLCNAVVETPEMHYADVDPITQERVDKYDRIELCNGIYDIQAGSDYMARPPMPPTFIFLVDVSKSSFNSGLVNIFASTLIDLIKYDGLPGGQRAQIAIFTYDTNLHFYLIKPSFKVPQLIVVDPTEFDDAPFAEDVIVNVSEHKTLLINLLDSLSKIFAKNQSNGSCLLAAISLVTKVTKHLGGRLFVLQYSTALASESGLQIKPGNMEKKYLTMPTSPEPGRLSSEMHLNSISCYLFVFSSIYKNIVTLGEIVKRTGGELYYYTEDNSEARNQKFYYEFKNCITKDTCWEAVFRLRVSAGWKVAQCYGNYSVKTNNLLSTPTIDDSKALVYEFELDEEVARKEFFYLQTALLYTSSNGQRRIRVINYTVPLSDNLSDIYHTIDSQALGVYLIRMSMKQLEIGQDITVIRNVILQRAKRIVQEMSLACQISKAKNYTDSLETFRLIILSLLRHPVFSPNLSMPSKEIDSCNSLRLKLNFLNIEDTLTHFIPYLFSLHTMIENGVGYYAEDNNFIFPQPLSLSSQNLRNEGMYLMDDGEQLYIFIGSDVQPELLKNLFGVERLDQVSKLTENGVHYYNLKDPLIERIHCVIKELNERKSEKFALINVIKQGENSKEEKQFFKKLIEDKIDEFGSYPEFAAMLHKP